MKKFILMALVLGVYSMPSGATNVDNQELVFSNSTNAYLVAENNEVQTKAIQRKFTSKRALNTRRFSDVDKQDYTEDSAWVGATQKFEERPAAKHSKRLNRMFKSRRSFQQ